MPQPSIAALRCQNMVTMTQTSDCLVMPTEDCVRFVSSTKASDHVLGNGLLAKDMPVELVTIGDGRRVKRGEGEAFWVINWKQGLELQYFDFNFEELSNSNTSFCVEIEDDTVPDETVYEFGGGGSTLLKVTSELEAWAKIMEAAIRSMSNDDALVTLAKRKRTADKALSVAIESAMKDKSQPTIASLFETCGRR